MSEKSWTHNLTKSRDDLDNPDVFVEFCWSFFKAAPGTEQTALMSTLLDAEDSDITQHLEHQSAGWRPPSKCKTRWRVSYGFLWFPIRFWLNSDLSDQWDLCSCAWTALSFPLGAEVWQQGIGYLLLTRLYIISWPMASSLCFLPWPHYPKTLAGVPKLRQTHAQWPLKKKQTKHIFPPRAPNSWTMGLTMVNPTINHPQHDHKLVV